MRLAIGICLLLIPSLQLLNADESCSGMRSLRPSSCSQDVVLTLPSDGSGVYHLILNASMPIYSNENLHVELENEHLMKLGTADHLVYVVSHPSCDSIPRITNLRLNGQLLCANEPYLVNTKQAATKFSYTATHYGAKSIRNALGATLGGNNIFNPAKLQKNNFLSNLHLAQGYGQRQPQGAENHGHNFPQITGQSKSPSNPYPDNPFLASLGAPKSNNTNFYLNFGNIPVNRDIYPNNPFLNGQFAIRRAGQSTVSPSGINAQNQVNNICGYSTYALIKGGSEVQPGEFPWLGGLFQFGFDESNPTTPTYQCTINLVSEKHVITAAHCIEDADRPQTYVVLFGHQRDDSDRNYTRVRNINIHPEFQKANSTKHDVAVLTLNTLVAFTLVLKPICLWQPVDSDPRNGMVAGFGPDYTRVRKLALPIVSLEECRGSHAYFHYVTSDYTFCAGLRNNTGPCLGDSGAGFMQWVADRYYLRGLVSHSLNANGDCNLRQYVIFADLSKEVDWIKRTII